MNKILFGQSYYLRFDAKLWEAMQPYPPLGTLYAASYMRQRDYPVALFDAMLAESEDEWDQALHAERPHYAVIYEDNFNYLSKMCLLRMRQAAFTMIDMARRHACIVIVAGSDASDHAEAYLRRGADYVLLGEGEATLGELIDALEGRSQMPPHEIPGLAYHMRDEGAPQTHRNARRPDLKDLDALPFPAWDLVDVARYRDIWLQRHGYFSMNMVTTRGCPYHCNWCAKPIWGQRYNSRSAQNVAAELKWLHDTYQPDHIWFADDIMGLKPGWWRQFATELDASGVRLPFKCLSRADLITRGPEEVRAMARAGCDIVWIGAESGSQKILNAMEKGTRVEQIHEATRLLHAAGIRVGFFLQFGYPGETRADIEKTLQMVRDCRPDDIGMSVSYPLPGTRFHESIKIQLGEKQNWIDSADLDMMYRGPFATAFYRQLHTVLHKEFRSQRALDRWRQLLRRRHTPSRGDWREAFASLYRLLSLPLARARLNRLAHRPHKPPIEALPHMSLDDAAQPSPQE